jgi:hypothetical protein
MRRRTGHKSRPRAWCCARRAAVGSTPWAAQRARGLGRPSACVARSLRRSLGPRHRNPRRQTGCDCPPRFQPPVNVADCGRLLAGAERGGRVGEQLLSPSLPIPQPALFTLDRDPLAPTLVPLQLVRLRIRFRRSSPFCEYRGQDSVVPYRAPKSLELRLTAAALPPEINEGVQCYGSA